MGRTRLCSRPSGLVQDRSLPAISATVTEGKIICHCRDCLRERVREEMSDDIIVTV